MRALLILGLCISGLASARDYTPCFIAAGDRYQVSPHVLLGIAKTESGLNPFATNRNTNGTEDVGLMGINSIWLPQLAKYGITRERLFDPCTNVMVGAWIYAGHVRKYGYSWKAVGAFHSKTPDKSAVYVQKVAKAIYGPQQVLR